MKKELLIIAVALVSLSAQAQTPLKSSPSHAVTDTVAGNTVKYQYTGAAIVALSDLTVQYVVTKISGTVAGTILLQGSLDNVNFVTVGSAVTPTDVGVQTGSFAVPLHPYLFYRISYAGAGTMSAKIVSNYIARKRLQ